MTWREDLTAFLLEHGMFPDQAAEALEPLISNPAHCMAERWDDDTAGYHFTLRAALHMEAATAALTWIDAHAPQAWYRPIFAEWVPQPAPPAEPSR